MDSDAKRKIKSLEFNQDKVCMFCGELFNRTDQNFIMDWNISLSPEEAKAYGFKDDEFITDIGGSMHKECNEIVDAFCLGLLFDPQELKKQWSLP